MAGSAAKIIPMRKADTAKKVASIGTSADKLKEILTVQMASTLLEANQDNRPLRQPHINRIAGLIKAGKWQYNGDTIKVSDTGDVLDGQHRLWAVLESGLPIETIVVTGIPRSAFTTIDTIRQTRSWSDTLALKGVKRYRMVMAGGLGWLLRWQRGCMESWKDPINRIENSDIEAGLRDNPDFAKSIERAMCLRGLINPSIFAFLHYIIADINYELAERMIDILENPEAVGVNDPFYRLRSFLTTDHHKRKDPLYVIALAIKAANCAAMGLKMQNLHWKQQGKGAEKFPTLSVKPRKIAL